MLYLCFPTIVSDSWKYSSEEHLVLILTVVPHSTDSARNIRNIVHSIIIYFRKLLSTQDFQDESLFRKKNLTQVIFKMCSCTTAVCREILSRWGIPCHLWALLTSAQLTSGGIKEWHQNWEGGCQRHPNMLMALPMCLEVMSACHWGMQGMLWHLVKTLLLATEFCPNARVSAALPATESDVSTLPTRAFHPQLVASGDLATLLSSNAWANSSC